MMQSITLAQIPDLADLAGESCTDTDLIATYLSKTKGWLMEEAIGQVGFYRLETRDEFYESLTEDNADEIDPCIQAWIYTPMEVYLITRL